MLLMHEISELLSTVRLWYSSITMEKSLYEIKSEKLDHISRRSKIALKVGRAAVLTSEADKGTNANKGNHIRD